MISKVLAMNGGSLSEDNTRPRPGLPLLNLLEGDLGHRFARMFRLGLSSCVPTTEHSRRIQALSARSLTYISSKSHRAFSNLPRVQSIRTPAGAVIHSEQRGPTTPGQRSLRRNPASTADADVDPWPRVGKFRDRAEVKSPAVNTYARVKPSI